MRIFGSERMENILSKLGLRDGEKIAHPWITTALAKAQQKVEGRNFDIRKNLLKFDNVMNDQRKIIYEQRREIMTAQTVSDVIRDLRHEVIHGLVSQAIPPHSYPEQWDLQGLKDRAKEDLALDLPILDWGKEDGIAEKEIEERIVKTADETMAAKTAMVGTNAWNMRKRPLFSVFWIKRGKNISSASTNCVRASIARLWSARPA
jgi:preprotein translocase subunit SecA